MIWARYLIVDVCDFNFICLLLSVIEDPILLLTINTFFLTAFQPSVGKVLTTIPWLSTEWSMKFNMKLLESIPLPINDWYGVYQFCVDDHDLSRVPAMVISGARGQVEFDNNNPWNAYKYRYDNFFMETDRLYHIELHQRYISGGNYLYRVIIDGEEKFSKVVDDARQYYNVKVYFSTKLMSFSSAPVEISNLEHTNFL